MTLLKEEKRIAVEVEEDDGVTMLHAVEPVSVEWRERVSLELDLENPGGSTIVIAQPPPKSYSTHCGVPMIPTTAFYKCELYCMECGLKCGMFSPMAWIDDATPELHAAYRKVAAEWDEHVAPGILPDNREPLNPAEEQANAEARAWLERRAA